MNFSRQTRLFVIRPTLVYLGLWSDSAEMLVYGTGLAESAFAAYDQDIGPGDMTLGPAIGPFQMERATHDDIWTNFLAYHPDLAQLVINTRAPWPVPHVQMATNWAYATAMCRLQYYRQPDPLPAADDFAGLAAIYKRIYNTDAGKGSAAHFVAALKNNGVADV